MADVRIEGAADIATANTNQDLLDRNGAQMCAVMTAATVGYVDTIIANNRNGFGVTGYIFFRPEADAAATKYRMDFAIPAKSCVPLLIEGIKLWVKPTDKLTVNVNATGVNILAVGIGK